jgi:pyrrolidone-carboxylate peptidase
MYLFLHRMRHQAAPGHAGFEHVPRTPVTQLRYRQCRTLLLCTVTYGTTGRGCR